MWLRVTKGGAAWGDDDAHRTCRACGGDCNPEVVDGGDAVRVAWVCPVCGPQSVWEPLDR